MESECSAESPDEYFNALASPLSESGPLIQGTSGMLWSDAKRDDCDSNLKERRLETSSIEMDEHRLPDSI